MLEKIIRQCASYLEITSDLEVTRDGGYVLPIPNTVTVVVSQNADNEVVLMTNFGVLESNANTEDVYKQMMVGNLFGKETGGGMLGLDGEKNVVFIRKLPGEISYEDFLRNLEVFVNFSESWLSELPVVKQSPMVTPEDEDTKSEDKGA